MVVLLERLVGSSQSCGRPTKGATRFNEFRQAVGSIPPGTLAQRLVELEEAGVLERRVIDARPPRVEYRLTDEGRRLEARRRRRLGLRRPLSDPR